MTYEFMGADLETVEGKQAFADVYDAIMDSSEDPVAGEEFRENLKWEVWEAENPEAAGEFLAYARHHDSPHMRELAVFGAAVIMSKSPLLGKNILVELAYDEDENVRQEVLKTISGILTEDVYTDDRQALGLMGLQELVRHYTGLQRMPK